MSEGAVKTAGPIIDEVTSRAAEAKKVEEPGPPESRNRPLVVTTKEAESRPVVDKN